MQLTLTLTDEQVTLVLDALAEQPLKRVALVYSEIMVQVARQRVANLTPEPEAA